jgi:hypothetical protein
MHEGQERANRARSILKACRIKLGTDFEALTTSQIDALSAHAEQHRLNKYGPASMYRMPLRPNLQSFYDLLLRRAMHPAAAAPSSRSHSPKPRHRRA